MDKLKEEISARFKRLIEKQNIDVVDLEIKGSPKNPVIRVFMHVVGGISINKCAAINRELNALIESENIIASSYRIDVSSPGLDRPLQNQRDFARNSGRQVQISYNGNDGVREITGKIIQSAPDYVIVEYDGTQKEILYSHIDNAIIQIKWK